LESIKKAGEKHVPTSPQMNAMAQQVQLITPL